MMRERRRLCRIRTRECTVKCDYCRYEDSQDGLEDTEVTRKPGEREDGDGAHGEEETEGLALGSGECGTASWAVVVCNRNELVKALRSIRFRRGVLLG